MSRKQEIYGKGRIEGQFIGLRHEVLDSPAWKEMSLGARWFYVALVRQLSFKKYNNGRVFLSFRDAAKEIGASQKSIWIWQHEIEHYGFGFITKPGTIGQHGRAAEWRLTDYGWGELDGKPIRPTKEYLAWDGVLFDRSAIKGRQMSERKIVKREKKVLQPAVKGTAQEAIQNTVENGGAAVKSTAQGRPLNYVKSTAHLELPYPSVAPDSSPPIAAALPHCIGHNLGPLWSEPNIEELFGAHRDAVLRLAVLP